MTASIKMTKNGRTTLVNGTIENVREIYRGNDAVLGTVAWAVSTRETCYGRCGGYEIEATVSE